MQRQHEIKFYEDIFTAQFLQLRQNSLFRYILFSLEELHSNFNLQIPTHRTDWITFPNAHFSCNHPRHWDVRYYH